MAPTFLPGYNNTSQVQTQDANGNWVYPSSVNALRPQTGQHLFPISASAPLLRARGTNSESLTSDLGQLLFLNLFSPSDPLTMQRRNQSTLLSMDLDRPTATPYIFDPAANGTRYAVSYAPATGTYTLPGPIPFPPLTSRAATPAGSEFDPATWRSIMSQVARVDVNRTLTAYPTPDPTTGYIDIVNVPANATQYNQAVADRQLLAADLFNALRKGTGALDPATAAAAPYGPASPEFNAVRWLAQIAVNMVDYVDTDDFMTPFVWNPLDPTKPNDPANYAPPAPDVIGNHVVFGTELPRLLVNEAYVQWDDDPTDPKGAAKFNGNVWMELYNPHSPDWVSEGTAANPNPNPTHDDWARLFINANPTTQYAAYQVVLAKPGLTALRDPGNVTGDPAYVPGAAPNPMNIYTQTAAGPTATGDWGTTNATQIVLPIVPPADPYSGTPKGNTGFYVLGPQGPLAAGEDPGFPAVTQTSPNMTYVTLLADPPPTPTILLRRLACPAVPPGPTNPYITVDYMENGPPQVNDARAFVNNVANVNVVPVANRASWGRNQPFAADKSQLVKQAPNPAVVGAPQNTFYRQNAVEAAPPPSAATPGQTLKIPFDWLVHLDRQVLSPTELLFVSAFHPHELTQQFVIPVPSNGNPTTTFAQMVPWTNEAARLYRALDLIEAKGPAAGIVTGGRWPGKINLNTISAADLNIFLALADPQPGNFFTPQQATAIFNNLIQSRTPGVNGTPGIPGPNDRPFKGFSTGGTGPIVPPGDALSTPPMGATPSLASGPRGLDETFLRSNPAVPSLRLLEPTIPDPNNPGQFVAANPHPYQQMNLLTKLLNNVTTRSNVFSIYLTVGFFEVTRDTGTDANGAPVPLRPVLLGAEIGRSENRNIRHRMLAIVDRTQMTVVNGYLTSSNVNGPQPGVRETLTVTGGFPDPRTGRTWQPQAGTMLVIEPNTDNEETVTIQQDATGLFFYVVRPHPATPPPAPPPPATPPPVVNQVLIRGNPGPWLRYDPHKDSGVVRYFAVIE
jgi:hypothetical protein